MKYSRAVTHKLLILLLTIVLHSAFLTHYINPTSSLLFLFVVTISVNLTRSIVHFTRRVKRKPFFVFVIWLNPLLDYGCLDSTIGDEDKKETLRHMRRKDGRKH